jgi:hypothetical protein
VPARWLNRTALRLICASNEVVAVAAVATVGGGASAADGARTPSLAKPRLALIMVAPLTVRGSGFKARERITVTAGAGKGVPAGTLRLRATARGAFLASFESVPVVRCHPLVISAFGARGSRATRQVQHGPDCRAP